MLPNSLLFLIALLSTAGCRSQGESITTSLEPSAKPEGFLVIKDLVPESGKPGHFLVTCASSSGDKKQVYSQVEIETNKVCLSVESSPTTAVSPKPSGTGAPAGAPRDPAQGSGGWQDTATEATVDQSSAQGFEVVLVSQSTYLKASEAMNVAAATSSGLKAGSDFCVMNKKLSANMACKTAKNEIKVTGVSLAGCTLTSGYLYSPHVSVTPSVSACP